MDSLSLFFRTDDIDGPGTPVAKDDQPKKISQRVQAQFQRLRQDCQTETWAIALSKTERGLSFLIGGSYLFVFPDDSFLVLRDGHISVGIETDDSYMRLDGIKRIFL